MGKKKEKVVDLAQKPEKVSDEHLRQVQEVVNKVNEMQFKIGNIEAQKHAMLHDLAVAQDKIGVVQDMLLKEYGSYDVNLNDGSINRSNQDG